MNICKHVPKYIGPDSRHINITYGTKLRPLIHIRSNRLHTYFIQETEQPVHKQHFHSMYNMTNGYYNMQFWYISRSIASL